MDGEECDDGETSSHPLFLDGCRGCKVTVCKGILLGFIVVGMSMEDSTAQNAHGVLDAKESMGNKRHA